MSEFSCLNLNGQTEMNAAAKVVKISRFIDATLKQNLENDCILRCVGTSRSFPTGFYAEMDRKYGFSTSRLCKIFTEHGTLLIPQKQNTTKNK